MKLKDLVKKLSDKPDQNSEVEFVVYQKDTKAVVCLEMTKCTELLKALGKRKP